MIPAEDSQSTGEGSDEQLAAAGKTPPAAASAMAVAAAFAMCRAGKLATSMLERQLGIQGASLPYTTATVAVALAIFFPSQIGKLAPSDEALVGIVMQASISFSLPTFLSEINLHGYYVNSSRVAMEI